jgi:Family of unknown function (DUF5336)
MTYPSGGGPGQFPGQGPQQPQHQPPAYGVPQQQANPLAGVSLPVLLSLGVTLLGVVAYFCGFSDEAAQAEMQIVVMLVAGLLAAFRALPNGPRFLPVATVLSVAGALWELDAMIGIGEGQETPGILVVLLIMGILQMLVAVAALLFDFGVLKLPPPQPQYAPPAGQYPPQQPQQPTQQYGSPGAQTQYQPQPGQFPPPGQGQQHPGTPPGGYPQQS